MIRKEFPYRDRHGLLDVLEQLLSSQSSRLLEVNILPRYMIGKFEDEPRISIPEESVMEAVRKAELKPFYYEGNFTIDVLFAVLGMLKEDKYMPGYLVIHPKSFLKDTAHWDKASIETMAETLFLGMVVVEDAELDEEAFVVVGCAGVVPSLDTIVKSYKGDYQ